LGGKKKKNLTKIEENRIWKTKNLKEINKIKEKNLNQKLDQDYKELNEKSLIRY